MLFSVNTRGTTQTHCLVVLNQSQMTETALGLTPHSHDFHNTTNEKIVKMGKFKQQKIYRVIQRYRTVSSESNDVY